MKTNLVLVICFLVLLSASNTPEKLNSVDRAESKSRLNFLPFKEGAAIRSFTAVHFSLKEGSSFFNPELKDSGIYALQVAAAVLNSQEFRDSLAKYSFPCKNYDYKCSSNCNDCETDIIPTSAILDSLYRQTNVALKLELKGCGGGVYGETKENSFLISSCYYTVYDDKTIPFTYCYADHICHEYMHNVGFYHFQKARRRDRDKDIAEKTGWIAYDILVRWYRAGKKP